MGFRRKLYWLVLVLMPLLLLTDCGDLEPDPDTGTETDDTTAPIIEQVTAIASPTSSSTPDYTFSSTESGTITYGGSCYSSTIIANSGNNTIIFNALSDGYYDDCTITVKDSEGNESNTLTIPPFTVDTTVPDTTEPTASVIAATITSSDNATVRSSETGTAYLVNTAVMVSNLASITSSADNMSNSVAISLANTDTMLPATGLVVGIYKVYAEDSTGNLSDPSADNVTIVGTDYLNTIGNPVTRTNTIFRSNINPTFDFQTDAGGGTVTGIDFKMNATSNGGAPFNYPDSMATTVTIQILQGVAVIDTFTHSSYDSDSDTVTLTGSAALAGSTTYTLKLGCTTCANTGFDQTSTNATGWQFTTDYYETGYPVISLRGTTWSQQAYIKAANNDVGDSFGQSLDLDNNTLVTGAPFEDSNQKTITNGTSASSDDSLSNSGAVYIYSFTGK